MKRGQMKISFGMIVSIILIIFFLAFAFYAIKMFIGFQDCAKASVFINDLQNDVNRIWQSTQSSEQVQYAVASGTKYICFIDFSSDSRGENSGFYSEIKFFADYVNDNFAFYPSKCSEEGASNINHINLEEITFDENPFCIPVVNGKASFYLKKDYGESLVRITEK